MYLKSIEVQGFKSFANKTIMQFPEGVTCIVGPNGSGKSNIADAVRWVLGEQKVKQLRGSTMQDVIFAGTEIKKPQGFALVAITLDNKDKSLPIDYTEVTVSRRLYRSGESEYMINGNEVRLKDIQELFYDTGIGKEGYSIIGQGQIEAILNGRPEDRRGLFDEAAGIVKFKRKKQVAEKKLESERASLLRVSDILSELQRQIGPLKHQSEKARQYLDYRESLKKYDINLFLRDTERLIADITHTRDSYRIVSDSLDEARDRHEQLKESYEKLSEEIKSINRSVDINKDSIQRELLNISDLRSEIDITRERMASADNSLITARERIAEITAEIDSKKHRAAEYLAALCSTEQELEVLLSKEDVEFRDAEFTGLKNNIAYYRTALKRVLDIDDEAVEELIRGSQAYTEQSVQQGEDEQDESWLKVINDRKQRIAVIASERDRLDTEIGELMAGSESSSAKLRELNESINALSREYHIADTRLENIKNMAERYEGYGQSIRFVMQLKSRVRGIRGVVADLIHTQKEYETAIETALGGSIQNIVTDSEETAKILIEHLKKNKAGRATFLPLSAISSKEQADYKKALKEKGVIGRACDIVTTDDEFKALSEYLLGKTLVVDNIDNAVSIARKYRHSLRIVTLEGELLAAGGSMSGGAYRNSSNLIGRAREVSELTRKRDEILKKSELLNKELAETEASMQHSAERITALRAELSELMIEENTLNMQISADMKLRFSGIRQNIEFKLENLRRIFGELTGLKDELNRRNREMQEAISSAEQMKSSIELKRAERASAERRLEELKAEERSNAEKLEGLSGGERDFFEKREENSTLILNLEKETIRLENQMEKAQEKLDAVTDYIWREYELTVSTAKEYFDASLGAPAAIKAEADRLKALIKALGPVNVQSIEDYREASERYEFLTVQYNDLRESEQAIEAIIKELNIGMRKQFNEKFEEIRLRFDKVFKELFGGGTGTLELINDESGDILEAGIAISVQPPGKKLQNMMQLSGGEKALSAIALLFAIQGLKPSPFCILDEIEAALDDSNVSRFASYLHKLSDNTQFVVITHRRGTMESADRLYGITMQEKGITTLVSVDLISDKLS